MGAHSEDEVVTKRPPPLSKVSKAKPAKLPSFAAYNPDIGKKRPKAVAAKKSEAKAEKPSLKDDEPAHIKRPSTNSQEESVKSKARGRPKKQVPKSPTVNKVAAAQKKTQVKATKKSPAAQKKTQV